MCAAFLQWKAILALLLCCDTAATKTHTDLFTQVLRCLCVQLTCSLPRTEESRENCDIDVADGLVDRASAMDWIELAELLDTSFLKHSILDFLEVLVTERDTLPQPLWHQVQHKGGVHWCTPACT
jgi:hypothetical protein